jgi:hypothetical protein
MKLPTRNLQELSRELAPTLLIDRVISSRNAMHTQPRTSFVFIDRRPSSPRSLHA